MTTTTGSDGQTDLNAALVRVAAHDQAAFRLIFEHFAPRLKAYVLSQGSAVAAAEEVVQETMIKIWRKAEQFDPARASASTWIFTVARNTRIDLLRKTGRPEPDYNDPAFVSDPDPLPSEVLVRNEDAERVRRAIEALPKEQQEVLRLAYFEGQAHPEIATALGIPLGTVKSRIRLAVKAIRDNFGDES